ncbi:tRNA-intron lyase [Malassezia psittaci]|uniref:tRNA-splicing endonuclease subunit Sen2 n=1 Tax=Malassezia psittaci TaxID=1821823 RepID=A0AAF0JEW3_9BASI|nr:tRNA-intron lyase [Malassezia psittaci]
MSEVVASPRLQTGTSSEAKSVPRVKGAGKKATQIKRQIYASPLPTGRASTSGPLQEPQSWWDRLNNWTKWLYDNTSSAKLPQAWYDPVTNSVWMEDQGDAMHFWTHGFFGKGSLSRSEPTWIARKQAEISARERGEMTAEQLTRKRREERKLLKIERARAAVKAGIQLPDGVTALGGKWDQDDSNPNTENTQNHPLWKGDETLPEIQAGVARIKGLKYFSADIAQKDDVHPSQLSILDDSLEEGSLQNVEHFQLTMVEAFFLAGMLGCLEVYDANNEVSLVILLTIKILSVEALYQLCLATQLPAAFSPNPSAKSVWARPDNPFLLSYVVYHHFRSLGWVVKNGTKFCVDYLLYKKGPVFSHAEFAVLVIPEYEDQQDADECPFPQHHNAGDKSWVWFSMVNRVNSQVQKTLVLTHVQIPSKRSWQNFDLTSPEQLLASLQHGWFRVKEVAIRRWVPARMKP